VVVTDGACGLCLVCDARLEVKLPMDVRVWNSQMRQFEVKHQTCHPRRRK